MIPYSHRFHGHSSLRYVYKNGQAVRSRYMTIKYTSNPMRKNSRFAIVVSKKVHKGAVGRNRIRRRLYELIRSRMSDIPGVHDVVVIVSSGEVLALPQDELVATLEQLLEQANLYKTPKN